jgi:hypothetical protein
MPTLPRDLYPEAAGYQFDEPGGVLRTEVAGGAPRFALDWARGTQRFQVTIICDALQFSVWSTFYNWAIAKGSIAFDMPLDSGFGVAPHSVNIVPGSYSAARTGGVMTVVSFVAEAESQVYAMGAADAVALLALYEEYGDASTELLERLARFATVDTLVLP